jgi:hypothetical protein
MDEPIGPFDADPRHPLRWRRLHPAEHVDAESGPKNS